MGEKQAKPVDRDSRLKGVLFGARAKAWAKKSEPCLYPSSPPCGDPAIAAHSVQNNGTLKEIAEDGRVYMIEAEPMVGYPPKLPDFKRRSRNQATTFKGLCNPHDTKLFLPIDTNPLDPRDPEHAFLLAYRSLLKEAHTVEWVADMNSISYDQLVADGEIAAGGLHEAVKDRRSEDTVPMLREKRSMDRLYLARAYAGLRHEVVPLPTRSPTLAVSGFFSAGRIGQKECWCMLNVFPHAGGHLMLFSFKGHSEVAVRRFLLNPLKRAHGRDRERAASRVVLENCSNFAVSPSVCESFGVAQRQAIRDYFWGTTAMEQARFLEQIHPMYRAEMEAMVVDIVGELDPNERRLNLFEAVA